MIVLSKKEYTKSFEFRGEFSDKKEPIIVDHEPYRFKHGDYQGRYVSVLMLKRCNDMKSLKEDFFDRKGINHKPAERLRWLFRQAKKKKPQVMCPECGSSPVRYFLFFEDFISAISISVSSYISHYTACDYIICKGDLISQCNNLNQCELLPFDFETLAELSGFNLEQALNLYSKVFGMDFNPGTLNSESERDARKVIRFFEKQ